MPIIIIPTETLNALQREEIAFSDLVPMDVPSGPAVLLDSRNRTPIPQQLRWSIYERDGYKCRYCEKKWDLTIDHIMPESKGGSTIMENLQTLCGTCNRMKGDRV